MNLRKKSMTKKAYKEALANEGIEVEDMYVLWLKKDGTYEFKEVSDKLNIFLYSLSLYNYWKGEI